ncbi:MAG: TldD/PmbA family protein [Elusimicrobiota bacterium]
MDELKSLADDLLARIKARGHAGLDAEIYISRTRERGVEMRRGKLESLGDSVSEGAGLRLIREGRAAFAAAGSLSPERLNALFDEALAQLPYAEDDFFKSLPPQDAASPERDSASFLSSLRDESIFSRSWEQIIADVQVMAAAAQKTDARAIAVLRAGYGESESEVFIANSRGVRAHESGTSAGAGISALAQDGEEIQIGSASASARQPRNLDFALLGKEAASRAASLLGARAISSGQRAVIFEPWIAGEFLDIVADLLCADMIQKGKSLLAKKMGRKIASDLVSFIDDPRLPGGSASSLYDDEGCATRRKVMVQNGILQGYFHDTYTANKDGRRSNACAARGSYRGLPGPSPSNFYLAPGQSRPEEIIQGTMRGIIVMEVMGMHMVDTVSGEFSVGISGIAVENGKKSHPVRSAMISGNILDVLSRIDAVGSDLVFHGSTGSPTFRVADLSVA